MASDFLTRLAKEKAKKVDKEYGASAYGGSATLRSSGGSSSPSRSPAIATNGGGSGAPSTRASNFLTRLAKQKAEEIDKEYGADAYGGSQWTVLDKESGFNSWLEELNRFSQRMSDDYSSREGHYQSADTMGKYRDDAFANIGVMQNRANIYRNYFQQNRELYGDDTVDGILSALNEGGDYLEGVRSSLGSEYDYWSQWDTEDDYNNYQRRANLDIDAAKAELADLEGQLEEAKRERNTTRNIMVGSRYMTSGQIEEYGANRDEAQARYDELQGRVTALQEDIDIAERIAQGRRYSSYRDAEDWVENSQYRSTANGKEAKLNAWTGMYSETGFDDITYDYINRNEEARGHQMVNDIATNASLLGVDNSFLQQMTDDEIATFNYIYATQGADPAYEYISYLASDLNYRQRAQSEAEWAAYANEHPVGSSVFSVLESPLKGLSYIGQIADYAEDGKIDQNAGYNKFSYLNSAIRNEVTGIVEENWGGVGSFAYQTGMSMGDFLFNTAITGGNSALTLGIMGTGAAADATIDAKDRGLSDNQAFALGTIAGAAEIVTEKFSLDALLNGKWERGALQYILKNAFTEGSEEVGSDFINLFADILIAKDKSEWRQSINAYQEEGMSENEAFWHSVVDQAQTMGLDFLGGAISGGVMSGGFAGIHAAGNTVYNNQTGAEFQAMGDDVVQAVVQEGLASDPSTRSYQLAQQLQQKLANGESITNGELGRLYQANVQAINAEENSGELLTRAAEEVSARGRVTNSTALDILDSPTALSALQTEAGLTLTDDMSRAQRRKAVKAAVETLASREGGVLSALRETAQPKESADQRGAQTAQTETAQNTARPSSVAQQVHNIQSVNRAAAALGQQGAKVAADFYDGSADAAAYYGAFSAYYQAGVTGMDMDKVKTGYSTALNSAQRQAAYLAGQNDAAASLAAEQAQVKYATVYGEEAGLIQNDHTARIPQTEAVYLNTLGKALGTKIEIVDAVEHGGNGAYYAADGTIRIAANAENPAMVVASHEITHRLQELAPEQYRKYRDYANGKIAEQIGRSAVEEIKARYAESGINLTTEQAMDEVAAEFTEAMVKDGKLFRDLAQDNRSVARKMLDAIRDFIRRVKAAFRGDAAAQNSAAMEKYGVDMKTLEEAARMWNEALNEAKATAAAAKTTGSVVGTEGGYARVDGRFSLKGVVEDNGTLIALHNLTESKLLGALRLGGFPMPSIAVTRTDIPHTNFGEISLVMDKRAVDPKASRKNTVYSADAWTPTFPQVEYEADTQAERRISRRIGELSARVDPYFQDDLRRLQYGLDDYLNRHGCEEGLARWAMDNYGLKAAYLEEQGTHIEPSTTQREVEKGYNPERADKYQAIADALGTEDPDTIGSMNLKELREQHGEALEAAFPGMTKSAFRMSGILRQAQEYFRDQGGEPVYETVTDSAATRRAVDEALDRAEYERWVLDLYSGIEAASGVYNNKERFTPSGNRRSFQQTHYPVTLEGIVKAMAGQNGGNTKNVSGFYGVKSLRAGTAQRFKSIADMHKLEGRLQNLTEAEQQAISDALDERLIEITGELAEKSPGGAREYDYTQSDTIGHILVEIADGGNYTIDSIMRKFNGEYGYQIGNELAAKVRDLLFDVSQMPVNLFEAKPERAVSFDEVLAAVVPDGSSKELMDALAQARVRTLEYKSGDDADRIRQVNSVEGARFSLKSTDSRGRELTAEQLEYFRDSKAVDSKGRLMVLYHGTRDFDITIFRTGPTDGSNSVGLYLSDNPDVARMFATGGTSIPVSERTLSTSGDDGARQRGERPVYRLYANVTNPLIANAVTSDDSLGFQTWTQHFFYDIPTPQEMRDAGFSEKSVTTEQIAVFARENGYDGVIVQDLKEGYGIPGTDVIVFSPEQVKYADNPTPTTAPDIRYSLREQGALRAADIQALYEENQLLRDRVEYWKGQTRRTKRVTTDKKAVEQAARDLIRSYGSELAVDDIAGDLQSLYDYIASGYDGKNELTYTEARRRAEAIARQLVDNAVAADTELYDQYSDLRNYLRTTRLIVSEADSHDIPDYGAWRKQRFGRLNLTRGDASNIDQVYEELSELWPEFFNSQQEIHPTDQLLHIAEVADTLYDITEYNPFSQYMEQAVTGAANEVMETFFDLPQTRKTFADRQAMKLQEAKAKGQQRMQRLREQNAARLETLRQENRERVRRAVQRERDTRTRQLGRMKERYQARDAAGRERRSAAELRRKITRHTKALSQKLLRPTDKQHIPEQLRTPVAALLEAINQESQYTIDPETGKRSKNGAGDPTKRTEAFRALKEQYAKIVAEGGDMVIDPSLLGSDAEGIRGSFDAVIAMGDTRLADMNAGQLATVWQVVRAVEHSVSTAGKILSKTKFAATVDWANAMQRDTASRRAKRSLTKGHPLLDLENPYTFFSHFGDAGRDIYRMLRNAQDQQQLMADEVANAVRSIVSPKTVRSMERTTRTFTTERGDKLTLSTAQIMELYELMKRTQAHDHLLKGGIVQPEIESAKIRRGTDAILLTEGDLANIVGTLTDRQVQIADGLQRLTCGLLADYGNRASMDAYGYKKFTEQSYWPIQSAKEGIRSSVERGSGQTRSIANIGMAQAVTPHANNPLDLPGLFSTFSSHAGDMIDYAAWLLPMEDANRLFNFKFRDGEGNLTGKTIKGLLDRVGGEGSQRYWHNLMEDIQNGINAPGDSPMWDKIGKSIGNFKGAAVGGNLRVIIQQPTAFFRAAAVLSPADLSRGLARGVTRGNGWKKALQYSPIAKRKDTGSFDISSPRQMNEILFDDRTPVRKLNDALSAPAGMADAITWGRLWNACEWATAREHKSLQRGSEAFYQEVNELFTEVIDQTQVVDGVLQRSNIMRSSNAVVKQATSFMGEPIMSLNMMLRAYDQVRYEQNPKRRGRAIKALGRAATALVVTNTVNALAQSIIDAMRDDDEDKKYWERFRAAFTGITGEEESAWDKAVAAVFNGNLGGNMNLLAQIPFVKDVLSLLEGYDVSRTEMEIVSDLITAGQTAIDSADGSGKRTRAYAVKQLLAAGAKVFGIPVSNLTRDIWGIARSAAVETDNIPLQYEMEKAIYNITNDGNKGRYYDILFRALVQGDMDSYEHIRRELMEQMSVDGASIDSAMRSRYSKAVEEDPSFTLSQTARDLIGSWDSYGAESTESGDSFGADDLGPAAYERYASQRANDYRAMENGLESSPIFRGMSDESKDKVLKAAQDLVTKEALADNSGGRYEVTTKWMTLADDAEAMGIEPWEYVLFHVAYNEAETTRDESGDAVEGESKSDHVREWLELYAGLTDEQREFLWGTVYQSEW